MKRSRVRTTPLTLVRTAMANYFVDHGFAPVKTDGSELVFEPNAIGYAKLYSHSHDAAIRVYDKALNLIQTHEQAGKFKVW
jgi:hypothetical protein